MKILSVDTTAKICNINLIEDGKVLKYLEIEEDITHARRLMPGIDQILKETDISLKDIDLLGVVIGPGSFTGLRIGVSTIKGFSLSLEKDVITATSLELLEENILEEYGENILNNLDENILVSVIDARNDEVYASINISGIRENFAGNIIDFIHLLDLKIKEKNIIYKKIYIAGNGKELFKEKIENLKETDNFKIFELEYIYITDEKQRGKYLGRLMEKNISNKKKGSEVMPLYLKPSGIKIKKKKLD